MTAIGARRVGWRVRLTLGLTLLLAAGTAIALAAGPAAATDTQLSVPAVSADAQAAAQTATDQGYRTGIAVLDLQTGQYVGAGEDTSSFASESVVKVLIAANLIVTGQMSGNIESMAYQMITQSDDTDADELYGDTAGDGLITWAAQYYDIPFLGTPPSQPGWWGNTEINAKGMVYLYAAIAKDPQVGGWLMNAMANASEYGADGTYQYFGIPSATTGAAIKQGWGDDGDDSPNAVFNSTGYVDNDQYAVAILTDGPSSSYGDAISDMLTTEAKQLMPGGQLTTAVASSAAAAPAIAPAAATSAPATASPSTTQPAPPAQTATADSVQAPALTPTTVLGAGLLVLVLIGLCGYATVRRHRTSRHRTSRPRS